MCKTVLIGLILLFAVVGCATSPTAVPTPTTTPAVLADCFQSATAVAWLDDNGNGVWDEGERPLPGVQFALSPVAQDGTATSGEDGVAEIFAWAPGECMAITITAVAFPGYILTTPKILDYVAANTDYAFGFQPASASALVETETYIGAIFTADATAEFIAWLDEPADGFWTPTAEDAASFENELAAFLQESGDDTSRIVAQLPDYTRQYFGIVQNDEELMFANFLCDGADYDWMETAVIIEDGGDCYFQVIFNADANTYLSLSVNGES